jgi:hypothetical protein
MEGNPGKRLIARGPRMCAVEAQRCVDCVSAVLHAVLTRGATLRALFDANRRAWRSWTGCALVDDRLTCRRQRPRPWQIAHRGSDWRMVQLLNRGRTVLGPNYGQRARRSSPGQAPDPARRRLADIA